MTHGLQDRRDCDANRVAIEAIVIMLRLACFDFGGSEGTYTVEKDPCDFHT